MFTTDSHGSGNFPILVNRGDGERPHGYGGYMWAVVIVVIFLVIIFFAFAMMFRGRENHNSLGEMAPAIAAIAASRQPVSEHHGGHKEHWDMYGDTLKEFGNIKMEFKEDGWKLTREMDKNHYETALQMGEIKAEVAASERRILDKIAEDKYERVRDERDATRQENIALKYHPKVIRHPEYYETA